MATWKNRFSQHSLSAPATRWLNYGLLHNSSRGDRVHYHKRVNEYFVTTLSRSADLRPRFKGRDLYRRSSEAWRTSLRGNRFCDKVRK